MTTDNTDKNRLGDADNTLDGMNALFDRYVQGHVTDEEREQAEKLAEDFWDSVADAEGGEASIRELHEVDTDERRKLAETLGIDMPVKNRRRLLPRIVGYAAAAAVAVVVFGVGIHMLGSHYGEKGGKEVVAEARKSIIYSTGNGMQSVTTEDGSVICLNTRTRFGYDRASFNKDERRVSMPEGEAYFRIAKNRQKPFFVELGGYTVEVVGTSFNISHYRELDKCVVSVVTGKVRILDARGRQMAMLPKDREITLDLDGGGFSVQEKDCREAIGWTSGRLVLNGADFPELKMRIEQKFGVRVNLEGAIARKDIKFRASFDKDTPLSEVMRSLKSVYGIDYQITGSCVTLSGSE